MSLLDAVLFGCMQPKVKNYDVSDREHNYPGATVLEMTTPKGNYHTLGQVPLSYQLTSTTTLL